MPIIYEPAGAAREYAALAANLYRGCGHGCLYCYAPACLRMSKEKFHGDPQPRVGVLDALERDARRLAPDQTDLFTAESAEDAEKGLDGQPLAAYVELARKSNNNMRAMLQAVEAGSMMTRTAAEEKTLARRKARDHAAGRARPVTPGTCPQCGGPVARGKKFCGVQCYFGFLKSRKAKRTRKAVA